MLAADPQRGDRLLWQGNVWYLLRRVRGDRWQIGRGRHRGIVLTAHLDWNASWRGWLVENEDNKG